MTKQLAQLQQQLEQLQRQIETEELLTEIWLELGAYTDHLTPELRRRLRDHFEFDLSE